MRSMRHSARLRSGLAMARIGALAAFSARAILLGRALFYLLVMLVLARFWDGVAAEGAKHAMQLPSGMVLYVGIAEWIAISIPAIHLRLEDDIRSGSIEAHLLRPMPYLLGRISESIGGMSVRLGVLGLAGLAALLFFGRPVPSAGAWPSLIILGLLGGIVVILLNTIVGLSAFWLRRCLAAFLIMQKLIFLLGGLFAPLTLYPTWLERIAEASPFAAGLYWPAIVALRNDATTVVTAFAAVLVWIAMLGLACGVIWRAGMRRLLTRGI